MADPGGVAGIRSQAPRFFRFYILIFCNVAASDLGAPLRSWHPPLREILDPSLHTDLVYNRMSEFRFIYLARQE